MRIICSAICLPLTYPTEENALRDPSPKLESLLGILRSFNTSGLVRSRPSLSGEKVGLLRVSTYDPNACSIELWDTPACRAISIASPKLYKTCSVPTCFATSTASEAGSVNTEDMPTNLS